MYPSGCVCSGGKKSKEGDFWRKARLPPNIYLARHLGVVRYDFLTLLDVTRPIGRELSGEILRKEIYT